jgi:hypothetical protein
LLIALAALAGFGVAHLRSRWPRARAGAISVALVVIVTAEALVAPLPFFRAEPPASVYGILAGETRAVVAHLPLPPPVAPHSNVHYMAASTLHWRPILNGYSGFVPASYVQHFERLRTFPSAEALAYLEETGVTHVALEGGQFPEHPALEEVAIEGAVGIFRLRWERIDSGAR